MGVFVSDDGKKWPLGMEFLTAAAGGLVSDAARVAVLGINTGIDILSAPEDVWSGSALGVLNGIDHKLIQLPQSPATVEVVSDNVNDTSAGTGLRTLLVSYLDANYDLKTTTITMNGTTPVAFPETIMAVNSMIRVTAGTFKGANIGNISLRVAGGAGATYGYIVAGHGFMRSSAYTVPNGYILYLISSIVSLIATSGATKLATFSFPVMNATGAIVRALSFSTSSSVTPYRHEADGLPINIIQQKNTAWITVDSVTSDASSVMAGYTGIIIKNNRLIVS